MLRQFHDHCYYSDIESIGGWLSFDKRVTSDAPQEIVISFINPDNDKRYTYSIIGTPKQYGKLKKYRLFYSISLTVSDRVIKPSEGTLDLGASFNEYCNLNKTNGSVRTIDLNAYDNPSDHVNAIDLDTNLIARYGSEQVDLSECIAVCLSRCDASKMKR